MKKIGSLIFILCLYAMPSWALDVPPLAGQRVHDLAGVLSETQKQTLTQRLADFEKTTSNQVALLIIPSLEGEPIENFSLQVAETWKIGQKSRDNGLLVVIAVKDRKYRFEVGYGLEGSLPDGFVGSIGRQYFRPNFQQGDYFTGITQALEAVAKASKGEYQPMPKPENHADNLNQAIMSLIIAFVIIRSFGNKFMGGVVGFLEGIIFSSMLWTSSVAFAIAALVGGILGWLIASGNNRFMGGYGGFGGYGGYWSSSSGPSDFFSGGGGSFGGGGASGDW